MVYILMMVPTECGDHLRKPDQLLCYRFGASLGQAGRVDLFVAALSFAVAGEGGI